MGSLQRVDIDGWQPAAVHGTDIPLGHVPSTTADIAGCEQATANPRGSPRVPMEIQETLLPPQPVVFHHPIPTWKRRYMVFLFSLTAALLFADQNLLAPNLTAAANDFGFDEKEKDRYLGGYIMAAFFSVGAPAAILVGWLADKMNRRNLLFLVVLFGETPCIATYWVTQYWEFFLLRTLTGIAVGGCFPLVFSLLGDLFPITQRAGISAVVQIATGVGIAAGQGVAALVGPATNWRLPFVLVSAPTFGIALLMLLTTKEPPRGGFEEALREQYAEGGAYSETISWAKVRVLFRVPSNWLIILQGLPGSLPWGMLTTYFNDYLSQDKGYSIAMATLVILFFGLGGALGVIVGGAAGQWMYNKRKESVAYFIGICVLLGIGPMMYLVNAPLGRLPFGLTVFLSLFGGAIASVAGPNLRAVMLNVNEPETRGVALALQSVTDDLGKGLGPFIVAMFIQWLGRRDAFNIAVSGWVPCAALLASLAFCMRKDEKAMQQRLVSNIERARREADTDAVDFEVPTVPMSSSHHSVQGQNGALISMVGNGVSGHHEMHTDRVQLLTSNDSHHPAHAATTNRSLTHVPVPSWGSGTNGHLSHFSSDPLLENNSNTSPHSAMQHELLCIENPGGVGISSQKNSSNLVYEAVGQPALQPVHDHELSQDLLPSPGQSVHDGEAPASVIHVVADTQTAGMPSIRESRTGTSSLQTRGDIVDGKTVMHK